MDGMPKPLSTTRVTVVVTTRPGEELTVESAGDDLRLRVKPIRIAPALVGIVSVPAVVGALIHFAFPHLPWKNPNVVSMGPTIAWGVAGFLCVFLLVAFSVNVSRSRPGQSLLELKRVPDGVRCRCGGREMMLTEPRVAMANDPEVAAELHRAGVTLGPVRREAVVLQDAMTRVIVYSAGTPRAQSTLAEPIGRWLGS
jgi:hypothetical protein